MLDIINKKISFYIQAQRELECHPNRATREGADLLEFVAQELCSLRRLKARFEEGAGQ
jgi:hypothetical protein